MGIFWDKLQLIRQSGRPLVTAKPKAEIETKKPVAPKKATKVKKETAVSENDKGTGRET